MHSKRISYRSEAAGLIEHFTEEWVSDGHGEPEPASRLIRVLDVSYAGGQEGGEWDFDGEGAAGGAACAEDETDYAKHGAERGAEETWHRREGVCRGGGQAKPKLEVVACAHEV